MSASDRIDNYGADAENSRVGFLFNGVPLDEEEQGDHVNLMNSRDASYYEEEDDGRSEEEQGEDEDDGDHDGDGRGDDDGIYGEYEGDEDEEEGMMPTGAANGLFANMGFVAPGRVGDDYDETEGKEDDDNGNIKFTYGSFDFQPDSAAAAAGEDIDSAVSDEEGVRKAAAIEVPKMPVAFYEDVNAFLSRAPPQIDSGSAPPPKKAPRGTSTAINATAASSGMTGSLGPSGKPKSLKSKIKQIEKQRQLDESLLHEAFAYAEELNRETAAAEELIAKQRSSPRDRGADKGRVHQQMEPAPSSNRLLASALSAPALGAQAHAAQSKPSAADLYGQGAKASGSGGGGGKKTKGGRDKGREKGGMVGRLRSKTAGDSGSGGAFSNLSASSLDVLHQQQQRRSGLDIDSLVENFEKGILLNQLRQELAASKQSLQDSDAYMRQMSKDFMPRRK
jgi:hypothetical protein